MGSARRSRITHLLNAPVTYTLSHKKMIIGCCSSSKQLTFSEKCIPWDSRHFAVSRVRSIRQVLGQTNGAALLIFENPPPHFIIFSSIRYYKEPRIAFLIHGSSCSLKKITLLELPFNYENLISKLK